MLDGDVVVSDQRGEQPAPVGMLGAGYDLGSRIGNASQMAARCNIAMLVMSHNLGALTMVG